MKTKIIVLLTLLITTLSFAQVNTTTTTAGKYKMNVPDPGAKKDSIVVWDGTSKLLKVRPVSQITGSTNLDQLVTPTSISIFSSTGTDIVLPLATATNAGLLAPAEKTKLASISGTNTGDQDLSGLATTTAMTTALGNKVDKVAGKVLSTEDYTTAEKTKLASISGTNTGDQDLSGLATTTAMTTALGNKVDKVAGKSLLSDSEITRLGTLVNYTHPATHAPSVIAQDANNRFVTDIEKATWNAKQATLVSGTSIKTVESQSLLGSGNIDLSKTDVGLSNVDNTSDASKPISTATQTALNAKENLSSKGIANGYASLDASGKVPIAQINDALLGSVNYQGTYNAATNSPALPAVSTANKGFYFVVSAAGTQAGLTLNAGDWIISNGTAWGKIDNNNAVTAVNGATGNVTLSTSNIAEGTNLYYTDARVNANASVAASAASRHNAVTIGTANGLSLSTQALSLGLASASTTGALSSTDWNKFNNKQTAISGTVNYLTKFGSGGILESSVSVDAQGNIRIDGGSGDDTINLYKSTGASVGIRGATGGGKVVLSASNSLAPDLDITVGGSVRATIKNNGNLLVNTATDNGSGAKLQVNGNISATTLLVGASLILASDATNGQVVSNFGKGLKFYTNDGNSNPLSLSTTGEATFSSTVSASPATLSNQVTTLGQFGSNAFNSTAFLPLSGGTLSGSITAPAFFQSSDRRLKTILKRDGDVAYFKWKDKRDTKTHIGYIAQEVRKEFPDQVQKDEKGLLSVNYIEVLVAKVQALEKRIQELEQKK